MSESPPRKYRSPARKAAAEKTRASIIRAADALFRQHGWSGTTIAAIARGAGVSAETVYATFGGKLALLEALVEASVRREAPQIPMLEQDERRKILATRDPARQIELFAQDLAGILSQVAPLMAVVQGAAAGVPELAVLYRRLQEGRRRNLAVFVEALARNGPPAGAAQIDAATATLWRLASPELFTLMREIEGISVEQYADWLARSLAALLLDQPRGDRPEP